ncbi:hypothetical protein K7432_003005 [Basidiobolus ranarum]|uniref:Exonuclease domain-containing protein n=1 Tax=Basidiobolus ranarum TaxID=34480 RepID=A0ABR2X0L2_9FUNG
MEVGDIKKPIPNTVEGLRELLAELNLDTKGQKKILKEKLRKHMRKATTEKKVAESQQSDSLKEIKKKRLQPFDYYLCFDVEATCEEGVNFDFLNEIIEFPIILVDSNFEIVDTFHRYVKPSKNPTLSEFCTKLTGITQETIDKSASFGEVLLEFEVWLNQHSLFKENSSVFITDGPFDIRDFIEKQCDHSHIIRPKYFTRPWIDIRKLFGKFYKCEKRNINGMLAKLDLTFEGREHSGIDDAKNIAKIAKRMHEEGCILDTNCVLMTPPYKLRK